MIILTSRATNSYELEIEDSKLPDNWKDLDETEKLHYLIDNFKDEMFEVLQDNLEVDFDHYDNNSF